MSWGRAGWGQAKVHVLQAKGVDPSNVLDIDAAVRAVEVVPVGDDANVLTRRGKHYSLNASLNMIILCIDAMFVLAENALGGSDLGTEALNALAEGHR